MSAPKKSRTPTNQILITTKYFKWHFTLTEVLVGTSFFTIISKNHSISISLYVFQIFTCVKFHHIWHLILHKQNIIITIFLSLSKLQCTIHTCTIFWGEMLIWRNFVISFLCSFSFGVTQTSLLFIFFFLRMSHYQKHPALTVQHT